jgi:serine/threonine protein kinase
MKGRYAKASLSTKLSIWDRPTTSAQDIITNRTNDTSNDLKYPSERYKSVKTIGDGSASWIYEGLDTTNNKKVIIKKISKREIWTKELEILKKLTSDQKEEPAKILRYLDYYESYRFSYIITEFYEGRDLFEHIDLNVPYSLRKGLLIGLEMAKCVKVCHDNNVVHLDIKCENYMVRNRELFVDGKPDIILIDFGHADLIVGEPIDKLKRAYTYGTKYYICPEGYYEKISSSKSDIWSLAVCLSLLITGQYPFNATGNGYYDNAMRDDVQLYKSLPDSVVLFLKNSLDSIPFKRPCINDYIESLEIILESI